MRTPQMMTHQHTNRNIRLPLLVWVVAWLLTGSAGWAQNASAPATPATMISEITTLNMTPKAARPTTLIEPKSCVTAQCHANVKNMKVLHGPVNVNACEACHKLTNTAKHTYTLSRDKSQLCTFCHKIETAGNPVVHKPLATGDCLPCHNPHGGKTGKFIRGNTMRETCNQCHKDVVGTKKNVHGPVGAGACEACHTPHAGKYPKLLVAEGKGLCLTCHKEMSDQLKTVKVVHKPVATGECSQCHDPHASDHAMQTKAQPLALCTSCHEHDKIKDAATKAKYPHSIVVKDQACMNCHTAHGGQIAKLMKSTPQTVCMKCHNEKVKTPDGRVVNAVTEVTDSKLVKHGPVKDGNCSGCHNVHGSQVTRLLTKPYPETFYARFEGDNFALCFSCHEKKLVETKEVEGLTGFRNGTQNLHYLHVNKERGRTCRACHETHASPSPVHLRNSVPFGQWEMPINYLKSENGGSCAPGCHKEFAYDRKNAVAKPTTQPSEKDAKP